MDRSSTSTPSAEKPPVPYFYRFSFESTYKEGDISEKYDDVVKVDDYDIEVLSKDDGITAEDEYPEGGRGWAVVLGGFLFISSTLGLTNVWGIFQEHYRSVLLPHANMSTLAWIGSIQYALLFMPGLVSGRLFDIGIFHPVIISASCLLVISTMLVAECKEVWHFLLVQGVATGLACGFMYGSAMPAVAHWFNKKRATAFGIVATGSAYGGTVFPIVIRFLLPKVGFKWTMRILAFIILGHLLPANLLIRRRLAPKKVAGGLLNLKVFRSATYSIYVASAFVCFMGMDACWMFLSVSTVNAGISPDFAFYLVSMMNTASGIGRIIGGLLSDRFGCLNVVIPCCVMAAGVTMAWPWAQTEGTLVVVALSFGASAGAFMGLLVTPVAHLGGTEDVGRRTGMLLTVLSIGAVIGIPIDGAMNSTFNSFVPVGIYAGCIVLTSAALMFAARWKALGGFWGKF